MLAEHRGHREFTNDLDPIQRQIAVDLGGGEFLTLWSFHTRNDSYDDDNEDKDSTFRKRRLAIHRKFTCPFCDSCRGRVAEKKTSLPWVPDSAPLPFHGTDLCHQNIQAQDPDLQVPVWRKCPLPQERSHWMDKKEKADFWAVKLLGAQCV